MCVPALLYYTLVRSTTFSKRRDSSLVGHEIVVVAAYMTLILLTAADADIYTRFFPAYIVLLLLLGSSERNSFLLFW
jgi:hypothetical protein